MQHELWQEQFQQITCTNMTNKTLTMAEMAWQTTNVADNSIITCRPYNAIKQFQQPQVGKKIDEQIRRQVK